MSVNCIICGEASQPRTIKVRGGAEKVIHHCTPCNFDFFNEDPTASLAEGHLDKTRLAAAGLDIPSVEKDFENGTKQSKPFMPMFVDESDKGRNILEIGCSVGYFLKMLKDYGAHPYGVELNVDRTAYVNQALSIPCYETLEKCEAQGVKFKKIFLFYVLEYIPQPIAYFKRLVDLLEDGGSIILVSPNLEDYLKDVWMNPGFNAFFYDAHAINYFSYSTIKRFADRLPVKDYKTYTKQGYSFMNHTSWHLTNGPRTTGIVGGDRFVEDVIELYETSNVSFKDEAIALFRKMDKEYKDFIESKDYGNQIYLILNK